MAFAVLKLAILSARSDKTHRVSLCFIPQHMNAQYSVVLLESFSYAAIIYLINTYPACRPREH